MQEDLLTVKEFATAAGVTTQSIYAACKGRLQPFCKQVGKKTFIFAAGLQLYKPSSTNASKQNSDEILQTDCKPTLQLDFDKLQNELQNYKAVANEREKLNTAYKEEIQALSDALEQARQQLAVKDNQIAELTSLLQAAQQSTQAALQATGQAQVIAYHGQQNALESRTGGHIARIFGKIKK